MIRFAMISLTLPTCPMPRNERQAQSNASPIT
jgi:hypothetical protein